MTLLRCGSDPPQPSRFGNCGRAEYGKTERERAKARSRSMSQTSPLREQPFSPFQAEAQHAAGLPVIQRRKLRRGIADPFDQRVDGAGFQDKSGDAATGGDPSGCFRVPIQADEVSRVVSSFPLTEASLPQKGHL